MSWRSRIFSYLAPAVMAVSGLAFGSQTEIDRQSDDRHSLELQLELDRRDLEARMYNKVKEFYDLDNVSICKRTSGPFLPRKSAFNVVLVHGSDSRPKYMEALKNDIKVWKRIFESQGYEVTEICSDVHTKDDLEEALAESAENSSPVGQVYWFFASHGIKGKETSLQFQGDYSGDDRSSENATATISRSDLEAAIQRLSGRFSVFFDNCYALDPLTKGVQVDSSDSKTPSYWAQHVPMGLFMLAVGYTHAVDGDDLLQIVNDMKLDPSSLPPDTRHLMRNNPKAYSTITVRFNDDHNSMLAQF